MVRRSNSVTDGTPVKIPDIFRAPENKENAVQTKKRKQGGGNEEEMKRRNTSTEPGIEEGITRRNSFGGPLNTDLRRTSGLPVSRAKLVGKAEEAVPPRVVAKPNP